MRKALIICIVLAVAAALTASLATAATTRTVKVGDNWFYKSKPKHPSIRVKQNTKVKFKFVGDSPHNVYGYRGSRHRNKFHSSIKSSGYYNRNMKTRGTFTIYCRIHGKSDQSMTIKVVR